MKRSVGSRVVLLLTGAFAWLAFAAGLAHGQTAAARPAPDPEAGRQAYTDNCARCHGATGAGDGRDARRMHPRPRKLSEGVFKFRTTASGTPPTDEDLYQTISEGLPGSRMPEFQRLPEETRWHLVYYVKGLSPIFQEQKPEPLDLGKDPGPARANLQHGKELYAQLGCNACHGNTGRADGPSAATLVDQWAEPIRAADLTQGWSYRSGSAPRDIMARLMTGIDGTPMPSYAEAVKPEEVWDLAYYVQSLQAPPRWGRTAEATRVEGAMPVNPDDPSWQKAPRTDLKLSNLFYRDGEIVPASARACSVQALYNENELAFRLSWHDATESREAPADAAAVVFLPEHGAKWRTGSLRSWPAEQGASNLESMQWSAAEPSAGGAPAASYAEGEWAVVLRRSFQSPRPARSAFGVAVWDGGNAEQGRHRANSSWVDLVLR